MAQEGKKISFGFSKTIKKPELKTISKTNNEKKIDYIEYVDDKSIKVIGEEEKKAGPLIIPMLGPKSWQDRILNKINVDIYGEKKDKTDSNKKEIKIKTELIESTESNDKQSTETLTNIKSEQVKDSSLSLDDQAVQEIIHDLKKTEETQENSTNLVIEQASNLAGEKEPTLENYEEIPIEQYGMAMLRGMGWEPGKGIGKNAQVIKSIMPKLRAKGIGLGADKVIQQKKAIQNQKNNTEKLKIEKGSFLKITAGRHIGNYGVVEGFDDDSNRIIVKLALINKIISLNDPIVESVTRDEYEKSSRVLNASMYEKYKNENKKRDKDSDTDSSENDERVNHKERSTNKKSRKTSKECEKYSSFSDNRDSSDSDDKYKKSNDRSENYHKSKKSKKHRHRDHSKSRKPKKSHKKDKKREKSEKYNDKKKHRKYKRSRSRSRSPSRTSRR